MLHEGDEILEVNGIEMKGRNVNQVCDLLAEMTGSSFVLVFLIVSFSIFSIQNICAKNYYHYSVEWFFSGTLTFVIAVRENIVKTSPSQQQQIIHLKALFDYDPDDDLYIPCRELGICFNKGTFCFNKDTFCLL